MRQWKWNQPRRLPQHRMWLWCRRRNDRDYLHVSCGVREWRKDIARWKRSSFTVALRRRRLVFHGSIWESWIDFSVLWKSARAILPANWTWKGTSRPFTQTRNRSDAACVQRRSTDWTTSDSTSNEFTKMRFNWARLQAMPSTGVATMQKWSMGMWSRRLIFLVLIPKRWSKLSHRTMSTDEVEQQYPMIDAQFDKPMLTWSVGFNAEIQEPLFWLLLAKQHPGFVNSALHLDQLSKLISTTIGTCFNNHCNKIVSVKAFAVTRLVTSFLSLF